MSSAPGSSHSIPSGAPLPDDIRLKCSYYASEIKTQVSSLFEEQHKWLEDHLIEIKDTMVKATQKKAGTRAVLAGIIKTPSRKRNKILSKKTSKTDQLGGVLPIKSTNPSFPFSEIKRSQLNINSVEIQEIIQQQLEKERNEIESRLQQELSSLNHHYESPVKKSTDSSTLTSEIHGNQSPISIWKPAGLPQSTKSTTTSSLSGPLNLADAPFPTLPPLSTDQLSHPEPIDKAHCPSLLHQTAENERYSTIEPGLNSSASTGEHLDVNDPFGTNGHELSAIQEGEEDEDSNVPPQIPGSLVSQKVMNKVLASPTKVQKPAANNIFLYSPRISNLTTTPPLENDATIPSLQSQSQLIPAENPSLPPDDPASSTDPCQRPASSLDLSLAPAQNLADTVALNSHHSAAQTLCSSEPHLVNRSPGATSLIEPQPDVQVETSKVVNSLAPQLHSITYPFALLPSAVAPSIVSELPSSLKPSTSVNLAVDSVTPALSPSLFSNSDGGPVVKQELEDNPSHAQLPDTLQRSKPVHAHNDTVVEVPLNDNPSSLRQNLFASIGSSHSERLTDHQTRTPGELKTGNLFTPGNTRAAIIQSPQSKWSSKPSGVSWTQHKPHKTPATNLNFGTVGQHERRNSRVSGSPAEDLPKSFSLFQSGPAPDVPMASSLAQSTSLIDSQDYRRTGLKRTSTDAGFNHDSHDAKMSRSHTPGLMNTRSSTTGGTARKGMEDLKSRLSKIQRESAMHERVYHHAPGFLVTDAPINVNQSTSLLTHNNASSFSKSVPILTPLPSIASLPKNSSFVATSSIAGDRHERDRTAEVQVMHQNSTAPVEDLAFTKTLGAHAITEPITLHDNAIALERLGNSSTKPISAQVSTVEPHPLKRRSSSSSLVSKVIDSYEAKASVTKVHIDKQASVVQSAKVQSPFNITTVQPIAKVEDKHLAFLKGISSTVSAPTPSVTLMNQSVNKTNAKAGSLRHSSILEDNIHQYDQPDIDENELTDCEPGANNQHSEPTGIIPENQSGNTSNEDTGIHETQAEKEDQEDENDDRNGDLSVEICSSNRIRTLDKNLHAELHLSEEDELNRIQPGSNAVRPEVVKTPRNVPANPLSPTSTGFMGVFKAGAALATSWTTGKPKPELKSLQLAAAAAKKDQDEKDRKATLKEERRLMVAEKKQAEEKVKAENEKKARLAEVEKKKPEREGAPKTRTVFKTKVPLNHPPSGTRQPFTTDDAAKKRKMENDTNRILEKKAKELQQGDNYTLTKLPSSAQKAKGSYVPTRTAPTAPGSAMKPTGSKTQAGSTSLMKSSAPQHKANPPSRPPSQASQYNGALSVKSNVAPLHVKSNQASQSQNNSALATTNTTTSKNNQQLIKGKMTKTIEKEQEEYIELPDIDSEYSDDDESEHERKEAKLPDWAQSPALREALANQRKVNPDDVFGGSIPPPRMEEIFRARASKFRHRTSSANWTGADQLTALEEAEYAKRMGYVNKKSMKK